MNGVPKWVAWRRTSSRRSASLPTENGDDQARAVRMSAVETEELGRIGEKHLLFLVEDLQQMQELAELRRSGQMKSNFLSLISTP